MIFAHTIDKVLCRQKHQTRRVVKPHEYLVADGDLIKVEAVAKTRLRTVYEVGKQYAVQPGRGKKGVAYIELTGLREETVADISESDAQAEGFESKADFFATWRNIHGSNADLQQKIWVLEFRLRYS